MAILKATVGASTTGVDASSDFKRIEAQIKKMFAKAEGNLAGAMLHALAPTFSKSQRYCPKDTGDLVSSGYMEVVGRGKIPKVQMGYAKGGRPSYAIYVHEDLSAQHASPTRAKWLEAALKEDIGGIVAKVGEALQKGYVGNPVAATKGPFTKKSRADKKRKRKLGLKKRKKKKSTWGGKRKGAGRPLGSKTVNKKVAETKATNRDKRVADMKAANAARIKQLLGK